MRTRVALLVACLVSCFAPHATAFVPQDRLPSIKQIAAALKAYRSQWNGVIFKTRYEQDISFSDDRAKDIIEDTVIFEDGKIFIERELTHVSPRELPPFQHGTMSFDGERTYTVSFKDLDNQGQPRPNGVVIMPGLSYRHIDLHSPRNILAAWLYEFKMPLDEYFLDHSWHSVDVARGEEINGLDTILVTLRKHTKNDRFMELRYWLCPDRQFLPIRRDVANGSIGQPGTVFNRCRVQEFQWFDAGWFPTRLEWGLEEHSGYVNELHVTSIEFKKGSFEQRQAEVLTPPCMVNDVSRDEVYFLTDERYREELLIPPDVDDEEARRITLTYLAGVDPEIVEYVTAQKEQMLREVVMPEAPPASIPFSRYLLIGGILTAIAGGGVIIWKRRC